MCLNWIRYRRSILSDINECVKGTDNCDGNADCSNTEGSFECTCNEGYVGDGANCDGIYTNGLY